MGFIPGTYHCGVIGDGACTAPNHDNDPDFCICECHMTKIKRHRTRKTRSRMKTISMRPRRRGKCFAAFAPGDSSPRFIVSLDEMKANGGSTETAAPRAAKIAVGRSMKIGGYTFRRVK